MLEDLLHVWVGGQRSRHRWVLTTDSSRRERTSPEGPCCHSNAKRRRDARSEAGDHVRSLQRRQDDVEQPEGDEKHPRGPLWSLRAAEFRSAEQRHVPSRDEEQKSHDGTDRVECDAEADRAGRVVENVALETVTRWC